MPTIDTTAPGPVYSVPALIPVEVIPHLSSVEGFAPQPRLYCRELTLIANGIDQAVLRYELGDILQEESEEFDHYAPQDLVGKYCRVTILQEAPQTDIVWIGYILHPLLEREGVKDQSGNKLQARFQEFLAVGLAYFLGRDQINSGVIHKSGDPDYVRIQRPLIFNGGPSVQLDPSTDRRGNRHPTEGASGAYHFAADPAAGEDWSGSDIVTHLLTYHAPKDKDDAPAPTTYTLEIFDLMDAIYPEIPTANKTVLECLNEVASPQRGLQWWLETTWTNKDNHGAEIRVQTYALEEITLPSGGAFPANDNQQTVDFDQQSDVERHTLKRVASQRYHRFVARGARMTSTCTVGMPDETLEIDWTTANEDDYKAGASGDTDTLPAYSGLTDEKKGKRNDAYRQADQFYRVYSAFRIPIDWNAKTADGAFHDPEIRADAVPEIDIYTSELGDSLPVFPPGIRLLNRLRIKRGFDYTDAEAPVSNLPDDAVAEYAPPFAIFRVAIEPDKFQFAEAMNVADMAAGDMVSGKINVSYIVRMQESVPGILLDARGPRHVCALNHWTSAEPTRTDPQVDYDTLRATVCIEADAYAEAIYEPEVLPADTPIETLYVYMGDNYRLDYMPAKTVFDVVSGEPKLTTLGGVLRDDRTKLADIARIAGVWYCVDRQSLTVTFNHIKNVFELGMLIETAGTGATQEEINTVVSRISYDLVKMQMTVETSDATLDIRRLVA